MNTITINAKRSATYGVLGAVFSASVGFVMAQVGLRPAVPPMTGTAQVIEIDGDLVPVSLGPPIPYYTYNYQNTSDGAQLSIFIFGDYIFGEGFDGPNTP